MQYYVKNRLIFSAVRLKLLCILNEIIYGDFFLSIPYVEALELIVCKIEGIIFCNGVCVICIRHFLTCVFQSSENWKTFEKFSL